MPRSAGRERGDSEIGRRDEQCAKECPLKGRKGKERPERRKRKGGRRERRSDAKGKARNTNDEGQIVKERCSARLPVIFGNDQL